MLVADASGLVSLGSVTGEPNPLSLTFSQYTVLVPTVVRDELREIASYPDQHGEAAEVVLDRSDGRTSEMGCAVERAAEVVLDRSDAFETRSVELDGEFPLDDGENAAVTLANEVAAGVLLCDEFNSLGLIHASLANTRLVTTPTLLSVLVRTGQLDSSAAQGILAEISDARSLNSNSYVQRAQSILAVDDQ